MLVSSNLNMKIYIASNSPLSMIYEAEKKNTYGAYLLSLCPIISRSSMSAMGFGHSLRLCLKTSLHAIWLYVSHDVFVFFEV